MVYADEILDYSGQRKTGVLTGSYGPSADVSPEAGGTITVPQLTVNENGLITGAVERTVTLPSGGGGGGGGGGEEQFQQVYTTTLAEASASDTISIISEDMGGAYVDIVAAIMLPSSTIKEVEITYYADDQTIINGNKADIQSETTNSVIFSGTSNGGLYFSGKTVMANGDIASSILCFIPIIYPTEVCPGVSKMDFTLDGESPLVFPSGTTITVYARRKVTANA